ncbi:MAG: glycosyltransferase, partial [Bacillati bacterium]
MMYILLLSVHGLIRGHDLELGANADTGGQTGYVVDLARALGRHTEVGRVDLVTRLIRDPRYSADYAVPEESLEGSARIVRLPFGPARYLRKEMLWEHLDALVDSCLHFLRRQGRIPDAIHAHYADAGYVGTHLSRLLGVPLIFTGHSLGRFKRDRL